MRTISRHLLRFTLAVSLLAALCVALPQSDRGRSPYASAVSTLTLVDLVTAAPKPNCGTLCFSPHTGHKQPYCTSATGTNIQCVKTSGGCSTVFSCP